MSVLCVNYRKIAVMTVFAVMCLAVSSTYVWASKGDLIAVTKLADKVEAPLSIVYGKAEMIDIDGAVADVLVANPSVIAVQAVQSNRLYVVGTTVGDTNIIALDKEGNTIKRLDVHVRYDVQAIQALVNDLFPDENVKVSSIHDQILLTGNVSNPDVASKVSNIVAHYVSDLTDSEGAVDELVSSLLEVNGEQQVMLRVRVLEASRTVARELGIETNANDPDDLAAQPIFGRLPPQNQGGLLNYGTLASSVGLTNTPLATLGLVRNSDQGGIGALGVFIQALEQEDLVKVLAEPNLTAVSGEQAGFLAGGEFPVPQGLDQQGNLVVEFQPFGVSLNFRPVVLSDERISLQLNTEVSSLDYESAVVLSGVTVPGLDIRRAETTVEVPSGGTLMIAGLLQSEAVSGLSGLPGVNKAPVLGDLISSDSFQRDETELLVFITPYLVEPYKDEDRFEKKPNHEKRALALSFIGNIRRNFEISDEDELFGDDERIGYLLD